MYYMSSNNGLYLINEATLAVLKERYKDKWMNRSWQDIFSAWQETQIKKPKAKKPDLVDLILEGQE